MANGFKLNPLKRDGSNRSMSYEEARPNALI